MVKLLFICTHNRCRSIIAEAVARQRLPSTFEIRSAGSSPEGRVHPLSLKFLAERGYAIDGLVSKSWSDLGDWEPDVLVTVCDSAANEVCPVIFSPATKIHWGLNDPSKGASETANNRVQFMATIDTLEQRFDAVGQFFSAAKSIGELAAFMTQIHHD